MRKRVFIAHGWGGNPQEGWFPWLKRELEKRNFEVFVPQLPQADKPRIKTWIPALAKVITKPDSKTYFVGHSMGCQTIARYLENLPKKEKVGGAVFVAGFFKRLTGLESDPEVQKTDRHWLNAPIDFKKIKSHLNKSVAIFSDDDPYVPLDNQDDFRDKLGSEIIVKHNMDHFSGNRGFTKLPVALKAVLDISGK